MYYIYLTNLHHNIINNVDTRNTITTQGGFSQQIEYYFFKFSNSSWRR